MTANELFLKHIANYLAQYSGNIRYLRDAIDSGEVPSANDESIGPYLKKLKKHVGRSGKSDDESLLLRYGLTVPGLSRGIRPGISVLAPERGGFSKPRLEQAAAQIRRLWTALQFGRHFFGDLSSDPTTAFREISER